MTVRPHRAHGNRDTPCACQTLRPRAREGRWLGQTTAKQKSIQQAEKPADGRDSPSQKQPNHLDITEFSQQPFPEHPLLTPGQDSPQELHWSNGGTEGVTM